MTIFFAKVSATAIAIGLITAAVSAILYFMALPIFDPVALAWVFFIGLIGAAIAALAIAVRGIWENQNASDNY